MDASLTIVIVSYNTHDILQRCLGHLLLLQEKMTCQLVVVDNASEDGSTELLQEHLPQIDLICNDANVGFAKANNQGMAHATGNLILLLNSDAFISIEAVQILIDYMIKHPTVGVCGPQLLFEDGRWQRSYGMIPSPQSALLDAFGVSSIQHIILKVLWLTGIGRISRTVGYVDGACMMIRRSVLDMIGTLDEAYFFFVEDAEFCARVSDAGYLVRYVPASHVIHLRGGSSSKKNKVRTTWMKRESLRYFISERYGADGWTRFSAWTQRNFRARYTVCRIGELMGLNLGDRCTEYLEILEAFQR